MVENWKRTDLLSKYFLSILQSKPPGQQKSLTMRQNTTELVLLHKLWRFTNQHHAFVNFQVHFGQDRWLLTESRSLCL